MNPFALVEAMPLSGDVERQARRRANAQLIVREFLDAGHPPSIALAAVANAHIESALDADAVNWSDVSTSGSKGVSVGLFQLRDPGAGAGMTVAQRQDPLVNTRVILREYARYGKPLIEAHAQGATISRLAALFGRHVERGLGDEKRAARARELFGPYADMPAADADRALAPVFQTVLPARWSAPWMAPMSVAAVLLGLTVVWFARR